MIEIYTNNMTSVKKRLLLTLIFMCLCQEMIAQEFKPVIVIGVNGSQIDGDKIWGYDKGGMNAGAGVIYNAGKKNWELEFDITYSQKGARSSRDDAFFMLYRLNYIAMPLVISYVSQKSHVKAQAGIGTSILVGQYFDDNGFVTRQFASPVKPMDHTIIAGLEVPLTPRLGLNLRFNYSIIAVVERPVFFNNYLSFCLRYYPSKSY
jgi:hypothetical protein